MSLDQVTLAIDDRAQIALSVIIGFAMFSVALGLTAEDFRRVAKRPGLVIYGVLLQIVGLQVLTFGLSFVLAPMPSLALGMMIVAACPGGNLSNLLTMAARGEAALSVSLTAITSLLAAITTPLGIVFWTSIHPATAELIDEIGFDRQQFLLQAVLVLGVPLLIGLLVRARFTALAIKLHRGCYRSSLAALSLFIIGAIVAHYDHLGLFLREVMPLVIVHNACALLFGYCGAWAVRARPAARRAFTFEIGIQNSGLGLVLILGHFPGLGGAALTTAGWGVWHLISGALLAWYWSRRPPAE
ncbi:bile acid:sodium symporter family protein [Haliangium ochraceum]|uniref:Bile acid:sodium symporter n=1 Tax=Haliangium ochraceum (strain DSM 14365 / JCM 11303 / SMP-2) TaxID=502025 RepID=D0LHS3_HALO1|nr:bile acid:sodium symporter [Haliangium ochraceum]ACY14752.1 Bile acid:sodium symporter [Haliangium ochraceum DSM 14365]